MRPLAMICMGIWATLGMANGKGDAPTGKGTATGRRATAVERLKEIEQEIRGRQSESDAEVREARERAKRITKEAEEESARIRAESDAYTKKVQAEIREIREQGNIPTLPPPPGAPSRHEMSETLASLTDPMIACWEPVRGPATRPTRAEIEACLVARVREKFRDRLGK